MSGTLKRQLSLGDGIVFAFSSVVGAGILFLPSLVYSIAGRDSLISWVGAIALAFPLLMILTDMVKRVPDGSGIEGFISLGLGEHAAAAVPWLLLMILFFGGSGSTYVGGQFVELTFGGGSTIVIFVSIAVAILVPVLGLSLGKTVQRIITWGTVVFAAVILALSLPEVSRHPIAAMTPHGDALQPILKGVVAAFFGFVGLENLTFIAGEFKNPERDFFLSALIAFVLYTLLLLGLAFSFGMIVGPGGGFDETAGLVGLALTFGRGVGQIASVFATLVVIMCLAGWAWGMSRMIYKSAEAGRLPKYFARIGEDGVPRRAVGLVAALYLGGTAVLLARPAWSGLFLVIVGGVGCLLYLLALASYLRIGQRLAWRVLSLLLFLVIVVNLVSVGRPIIIPIVVGMFGVLRAVWLRRTRA